MTSTPQPHRRRSIRLEGYDYSQAGAYFVTVCVHRGRTLLGEVIDGVQHLSQFGELVAHAWDDLPKHYRHVELDAFVIMPNHVHGIIVLTDDDDANAASPATRHGLPEIVRAFKTFSARRINAVRATVGAPLWQRNYYEHIVRNERALEAIRQYIVDNPANWRADQLHPDAPTNKFNVDWKR